MERICNLSGNDTTKIGMLPSASKDVSIKFAYQCINILNTKEILNGIKGSTKIQKIEPLFKYQLRIYNVQRNSNVNWRGMKIRWNKKLFNL